MKPTVALILTLLFSHLAMADGPKNVSCRGADHISVKLSLANGKNTYDVKEKKVVIASGDSIAAIPVTTGTQYKGYRTLGHKQFETLILFVSRLKADDGVSLVGQLRYAKTVAAGFGDEIPVKCSYVNN